MFVLLMACVQAPDQQGIAIGNPPSVAARLAPVDGAQVTAARMHVSEVTAGCGAELSVVTDVGALDLLGANELPIPTDSACSLSVGASSALDLAFLRDDGAQVSGSIDIGTLSLLSEEPLDLSGSWVLELGAPGWLNAEMLAGDAALEPGSESYGLIVAALRSGSSVFADVDGDGRLGTSERSSGASLRSSADDDVLGGHQGEDEDNDQDDGDDDDTGCPYANDDTGA